MKVLYLITARAGSKRVPGKNLYELTGISLVGFKAISARKSKYCARLMISTDSREIQENARAYGVEVPFTRPSELATDTASSVSVVLHAMSWIEQEKKDRYDALMLLEPAAPFARANDYDNAVEMMTRVGADVVVGVRPVSINSIFIGPLDHEGRITSIIEKMKPWQESGSPRLPEEYTMNGALYLFRWDYFKQHKSIYHDGNTTYGYVMDPCYSIEIDTPADLLQAEFMVERGYVDMSHWR